LELVELRGLERLRVRLEDGGGVVHPLVQPEPEELVGDVVADLDLGLTGSHRRLLGAEWKGGTAWALSRRREAARWARGCPSCRRRRRSRTPARRPPGGGCTRGGAPCRS